MRTKEQVSTKATPPSAFTHASTGLLQRQCACGGMAGFEGECAECRHRRLRLNTSAFGQSSPDSAASTGRGHDFSHVNVHEDAPQTVQTKLKVNEPGDKFEREADRVAEQVMRMPEPKIEREEEFSAQSSRFPIRRFDSAREQLHRQPLEEEEEELQLQPLEEEEEELLQAKQLHAPETDQQSTYVSRGEMHFMRGQGRPLDTATRRFMETRLDNDELKKKLVEGSSIP